jgi:OPA family glycerol-3-phosphate transporter-like MFS transporter
MPSRMGSQNSPSNRLFRWQALTVALLVAGYAGYYLCRSNFSVALPMIIDDMAGNGWNADEAKISLGTLASAGVLAYALGKFLSGGLADFLGGRRNFLVGMAGSVLFTALFAMGGGAPLFTLAWIGNRLIQSLGWPGVVKVASRWFSFSSYGAAMGFISLSYLFGDALARRFMGWLINQGVGWRGVFFAAAAVLSALFLLNLLLLRESPKQVGEAEPEVNPANLFGESGAAPAPVSLKSLLSTFARSRSFWIVCLLSLGFTLLRETFNTWTPTYFTQVAGLSSSEAASKSALFPFFGGVSVLLAGFLGDRLKQQGRAVIILVGLLLTCAGLIALGAYDFGSSKSIPVLLVSAVAFVMIGPYSYLAGAISLDFGGKQASATAAGIIDGVGYLGGVLAGESVARVSVVYGWQGAFTALAGVALLSSLAAALFLIEQRRSLKTKIG